MSIDDELSIGETVDEIKPEESLSDPVADFNLKAFMEGIRPGRVTVRLYARPDLDQQITQINSDAYEAQIRGDRVRLRELDNQKRILEEAFFKHSLDLVIEERSKEWQADMRRVIRTQGVTDDRLETLSLIAKQIVQPAGAVTGDDLLQMSTIIPTQIRQLVEAWASLHKMGNVGLPVF